MKTSSIPETFRIALLPKEHGELACERFFQQGYEPFLPEDGGNPDQLIEAVESFARDAFDHAEDIFQGPIPVVDEPEELGLLATLGIICVGNHPRFEDHYEAWDGKNIQPLHDIRSFYYDNLVALTQQQDYAADLSQYVAEHLYEKDVQHDDITHPFRICTGIVNREGIDGACAEIPLVAASQSCLVWEGDDDDRQLRTELDNNCAYVPLSDLDSKHRSYIEGGGGFRTLLDVSREMLSEEQHYWLVESESAISEWIDRHAQARRYGKLWKTRDVHDEQIRAIKKVLSESSPQVLPEQSQYTASKLFEGISQYSPENSKMQSALNTIGSKRSLGSILQQAAEERRDVEMDQRNGHPNLYSISTDSSYEQVTVTEAEDMFELPCFAKMDKRLMHGDFTRKDLFSLVRTIMWLPPYYDQERGEILEDKVVNACHELFSRWPWYDEDITEYQVRYEYLRGERVGRYTVRSCTHDDMQRFCIGMDKCDYSIYQSLPFVDDLYNKVSEHQSESAAF